MSLFINQVFFVIYEIWKNNKGFFKDIGMNIRQSSKSGMPHLCTLRDWKAFHFCSITAPPLFAPISYAASAINGILLPKLFWPTVRKKCFSDREKLSKFRAEGWEFAKFLRSLEQFIQTVKGFFGNRMLFKLVPRGFSYLMN